jgi:hypothetical protein
MSNYVRSKQICQLCSSKPPLVSENNNNARNRKAVTCVWNVGVELMSLSADVFISENELQRTFRRCACKMFEVLFFVLTWVKMFSIKIETSCVLRYPSPTSPNRMNSYSLLKEGRQDLNSVIAKTFKPLPWDNNEMSCL